MGGPAPGTVLDVAEEHWRPAVESVLLGPLRLVKALVPHLGDGAAIGLVLSTSVREPIGHLAISNGLRPGLAMTAKALADELGPRGIRVVRADARHGSPPTGSPRSRPPPATPTPRARATEAGDPAAPGTAGPRSSAGWPPSCSPPPRPT